MTGDATRPLGGTDRAATSALTTVLTAAITTVLISGILIAGGQLVEDQRGNSIDRQLETIGERLVEELVRAEQIAAAGSNVRVSFETNHVEQVAGSGYAVSLAADPSCPGDADGCLTLRSVEPTVEVTIPFDSDVPVGPGSASGGAVRVVFDGQLTIEGGGSS
ncbi:DUF7266 family protein [Halorarum halobium]|uniref:DUF7266 family protein n=1 Tax=Halorarum halobium TaxID=3075121 RepID=UPI0028AB3770|nr:hypothetical protein [Halobaculum sp. XH14]